jgi:hypothetical protein
VDAIPPPYHGGGVSVSVAMRLTSHTVKNLIVRGVMAHEGRQSVTLENMMVSWS